ncbi:MAG: hypothetical protein IJF90_03095, partial [Synergistaceae bacterium]|nr:hypothetical protein [Synergistaceae bacterium]
HARNIFDKIVNFDEALSKLFSEQDYKIVVHKNFGTYTGTTEPKEFTKEYEFSSIVMSDDTSIKVKVDGYEVELNNGIYSTSISHTADTYNLEVTANNEHAHIGLDDPTTPHLHTITEIVDTPKDGDGNYDHTAAIPVIRIYVTAQDGTPVRTTSGYDYYILQITRKNSIADIDRVEAQGIGTESETTTVGDIKTIIKDNPTSKFSIDANEYTDDTRAFVIYYNTGQTTVTGDVYVTSESDGAQVALYSKVNGEWVVTGNNYNYESVDALLRRTVSGLSTTYNNGEYQLRVKSEGSKSDEDVKKYPLLLMEKDDDTRIKNIIIEEGNPGEYWANNESVWYAKAPQKDGSYATITIILNNEHATITEVKRVNSVELGSPETDPAKVLLRDNNTAGSLHGIQLPDGVKIKTEEFYSIKVRPHNGGAEKEYVLWLIGDDDEIGLRTVSKYTETNTPSDISYATHDGSKYYLDSDGVPSFNFMVADYEHIYVEALSENARISHVKMTPYYLNENDDLIEGKTLRDEEIGDQTYIWNEEAPLSEEDIDLNAAVNVIEITVYSKYYDKDNPERTPRAMQKYRIKLYTSSNRTDIGDVKVNGIVAKPRPENPTIYDVAIPSTDEWQNAEVEINALNGYTKIESTGKAVKGASTNTNVSALGQLIYWYRLNSDINTLRFETTSSSEISHQVYTLVVSKDREISKVQEVYVNDTKIEAKKNTNIDLSLFSISNIADNEYYATVNRRDPVNISILPEGATASVLLENDPDYTTGTLPAKGIEKYRGGVFEEVAQSPSGQTNLIFTVKAADYNDNGDATGHTNVYKLTIMYAGDDDTNVIKDVDTGEEGVSFQYTFTTGDGTNATKTITGTRVNPNANDTYYDDPVALTERAYDNKHIINLIGEEKTQGSIIIRGANEQQTIELYAPNGKNPFKVDNGDGTFSDATPIATSRFGVLSYVYNVEASIVEIPYTITSHGKFGTKADREVSYNILKFIKVSPQLEEVYTDGDRRYFNRVQYSYQTLPNAKKVRISVKASDPDAQVKIGDGSWVFDSDEQDYSIDVTGKSSYIVPLSIRFAPFGDTDVITRNLVITKGNANLKNVLVYTQDERTDISNVVSANEYGAFVATVDADKTYQFVTVTFDARRGYTLQLLDKNGEEIKGYTAGEDDDETNSNAS